MVKGFVAKVFGRRIVRGVFEFILVLAILYFSISGVLMLAFRTETYWMSVASNSMKHDGDSWRSFFENEVVRCEVLLQAGVLPSEDVDNFDTSKFQLRGGFERGDMLIIQGVGSVDEISVGDVIVFDVPGDSLPFVHRVINIRRENGEATFTTKGDRNAGIEQFERSIKPEQIKGKVVFVIPKLGYLGLWWQEVKDEATPGTRS